MIAHQDMVVPADHVQGQWMEDEEENVDLVIVKCVCLVVLIFFVAFINLYI